jgi:hypothetical protein
MCVQLVLLIGLVPVMFSVANAHRIAAEYNNSKYLMMGYIMSSSGSTGYNELSPVIDVAISDVKGAGMLNSTNVR